MSPSANRRPAASPSAAARASENGTSASTSAPPAQEAIQMATATGSGDRVGLSRADQREREQDESDEGDDDGDLFATCETARMSSGREEREHGDPRCAHRLHEGDRREAERCDVHEPTCRLGAEGGPPAAVAKERRDEANGLPRREARHRHRRVVLLCVRPVDRERRDEGERETDPGRHADNPRGWAVRTGCGAGRPGRRCRLPALAASTSRTGTRLSTVTTATCHAPRATVANASCVGGK